MSASEDLQSAVQPAASEALEGFPLSPLQTRAWRRHAERPENTVVGVRLHAPADPVATLERLRRALDGEAQLRVAYRTMPGMSLPVQVLDGRAADLLVERLPGDGDWAGRFARESARLAASPLGGKASRYWRSACCWTPPERRSRGCCWRRRRSSSMRPAWWRCCAAAWGRPARRARTRRRGAAVPAFLRVGQRGAGRRRRRKRQRLLASRRPLRRRVRWRWRTTWAKASGRRGACCRARCSNAWPPTACRRRPPCWPGPRSPGSSRATRTPSGNGATGLGAPVQRVRRAGRTVRRGRAAVPGECPRGQRRRAARRPPGGDPRPGGGSGPARSLCPRLAARRVGLRLAGGRTGWRRGGRAGLPSAAAGRVPRVAGAAPRRRQAGQPAGPSRP